MRITTDWQHVLQDEFSKPYFQELIQHLQAEYEHETVYPPKEHVFQAFNETSFEDTKVVILGQDPYHGPNQANGMSFSVQRGIPIPPSLRNIHKELADDLGCDRPSHGDLTKWAKQGVLLLNSVLTVKEGQALSHQNIGWEVFTDRVIEIISKQKENVVFILWGKQALVKGQGINPFKHYVVHAAHPSPLSAHRGFFGSKPFTDTNNYLTDKGLAPIDWKVD